MLRLGPATNPLAGDPWQRRHCRKVFRERQMLFEPRNDPHRRYNPLTGQWILVSPHRTKRPWQGQQERLADECRPAHDPTCYLCPGNRRAGDVVNPHYEGTFVFTNDFSALLPQTPASGPTHPLLQLESVAGECRVVCFSPRHDLTLPAMSVAEIAAVVQLWADQVADLGKTYRWVQVFENKGAVMGCSNPHPHGQIWASSHLPNEPQLEQTISGITGTSSTRPCCRLRESRMRAVRTDRGGQRALGCPGSLLGGLALRNAAPAAAARAAAAGSDRRGAAGPGSDPETAAHPVRQPVRNVLPLLHGLARGSHRRRRVPALAVARPLLSAPAAVGDRAKIHGRLRNAGRSPAGSHPRASGRKAAVAARSALSRRTGAGGTSAGRTASRKTLS